MSWGGDNAEYREPAFASTSYDITLSLDAFGPRVHEGGLGVGRLAGPEEFGEPVDARIRDLDDGSAAAATAGRAGGVLAGQRIEQCRLARAPEADQPELHFPSTAMP